MLPALRNNNPGNIQKSSETWQGSSGYDGVYVVFSSPMWGFRALYKDIYNTIQSGNDTLYKIFYHYLDVPNSHTPQDALDYANFVSDYTGTGINETFGTTLKNIVQGIIHQESGNDAIGFTQSDNDNGYLLFKGLEIASSPISWAVVLGFTIGGYYLLKKK